MALGGLTSILDDCIAALRRGESVESCLARYPKQAHQLRPLLTLARRVMQTPLAVPRSAAQGTAWRAVRQHAAGLRAAHGRRGMGLGLPGAWLRPAAVALALVLAFIGATGATVYAAQDSLPDSPLYRFKLATEDVHLWFIFDDSSKADVLLDQSGGRVDEIKEMLRQGKTVPGNVLSVLQDRNERAAGILEQHPDETALRARILSQSQSQEELLIAVWPEVAASARGEYTQTLAQVHNIRLQGSGAAVSIRPEELSGGVLNIAGEVESIGDGLWLVGGVEMRIDDRTIGQQDLRPGATARFVAARSASGRLHALSLTGLQPDSPPAAAVVSGAVENVTDDGISVAGQFIRLTPETLRTIELKVGQRVQVTMNNTTNGVVASSVKATGTDTAAAQTDGLTLEGSIEGSVTDTNEWIVAGLKFLTTPTTTLDAKTGKAQSGARVQVEATADNGKLLAQRITVLAAQAPADSVHVIGVFQGIESGLWLVSGLGLLPPATGPDPDMGALIAVDARHQGKDFMVTQVKTIQQAGDNSLVRFQGTITSIDGSLWTLESVRVRVTSTADVTGRSLVGVRVLGWGRRGQDGILQATAVRVLDQSSVVFTPTPTPAR